MIIEASAPGKMILVGEYAVLEGSPALVSAVNREAKVRLELTEGRGICVNAPQVQLHDHLVYLEDGRLNDGTAEALPPSLKVVAAVMEHFAEELEMRLNEERLVVTIDTAGFVQGDHGFKLGLGSSAAVTVALMRAVMELLGKEGADITKPELFTRAHRLHRKMQGGVGSGLDIAASVFGGLVAFPRTEPGEIVRPQPLDHLSWPSMASIFVGVSASTPALVMKVNTWRDRDPVGFKQLVDKMSQVSAQVIAASRAGDLNEVREGCSGYCHLMDRLGQQSGADIISEAHGRMRDASVEKGFDYKPSGAGGGDLGIILADRDEDLASSRADFESLGATWTELGISSFGVRFVRK